MKEMTMAVFFDGPFTEEVEGDESPYWAVYTGYESGEPVGLIRRFDDYETARQVAWELATRRGLELVQDAGD